MSNTREQRHQLFRHDTVGSQEETRNQAFETAEHGLPRRSVSRGRRRARILIEEPDRDGEGESKEDFEDGDAEDVERSPSVTFEGLRSTGPGPSNILSSIRKAREEDSLKG